MQYIEAISNEVAAVGNIKIFLAGGITKCPNWQEVLTNFLAPIDHITVYNPRRVNFPIEDPNQSLLQIQWEFQRLRTSNIIAMWFPKETLCPICLYELGAALERCRDGNIVIGVHNNYKRKQDVIVQTALIQPMIQINVGFSKFSSAVKDKIMEVKIRRTYTA